jgi:RNA polymerase sigma factor (sigma-70 family)
VWERLDDYDPKLGAFESWAFAIIRNTVIDYYRTRARELAKSSNLAGATSSPDIADSIALKDALRQSLSKLDSLDRELLILSTIHGLKAKEIQEVLSKRGLSLSGSAIYNRVYRARLRIAEVVSNLTGAPL